MRITETSPSKVQGYSVDLELQTQVAIRTVNRRSDIPEWQPLFYPDDFASENTIESLDQWKLSDADLVHYAKVASKIRTNIRVEALKIFKALSDNRQAVNNELSPFELQVR